MAAVLWGGPHSAASHRAAAALWKLDGIEERVVEISISSGRRTPGIMVHRRRDRDVPPTVHRDAIPTTRIERTILDLAGVVSPNRLGLALDAALRNGLTSLERIAHEAESLGRRGRSGMASISSLLAVRDERESRAESRLETAMLQLIRAHGLPAPTPQYKVFEQRAVVARLDFAYPESLTGIEADGYRWHSGRQRWARDIRRENRLKLLGWTVLRFSWEDVFQRPEVVAAQIRSALASRVLNLS